MLYPVATTPLLNDHLEDAPHDGDGTEAQKESPVAHDQRDGNRTEPRSPDAGGESYQDVIQKIRPIIVELERQVGNLMLRRSVRGMTRRGVLASVPVGSSQSP